MRVRLVRGRSLAAVALLAACCGVCGVGWPTVSPSAGMLSRQNGASAQARAGAEAAAGQAIAVGGVNVPAIAVDQKTHLVWAAVATQGRNDYVDQISEATRAVIRSFRVPATVDTIAADPVSGMVWTGSASSATLTGIAEASGATRGVDLSSADPSGIQAVAIDPAIGEVFVVTIGGDLVAISEHTGTWRVVDTLSTVGSIAVDPSAGRIWITNEGSSVLGFTENGSLVADLNVGSSPFAVAADPVTQAVWVANQGDSTVNEIAEAGSVVGGPISVGHAPAGLAADPATGTVWAVNLASGTMSQIRESTAAVVGAVSTGVVTNPYSVAADPGNGRVYVGGFTVGLTGAIIAYSPAAPAFTSPMSAWFATDDAHEDRVAITTAGFPLPTFAITSPGPPAWLRLNRSTGVLSGTPPSTATGSSIALTITASNSVAAVQQEFTLKLGTDPVFRSAAAAVFTVGTTGRFTVRASGTPAPRIGIASGSLPAGLRLSSQGVLSGVPAVGTGGRRRLVLVAANALRRVTQPFTLTIDQPPRITSPAKVSGRPGRRFAFSVRGTGFPVPVLKVSGRLPAGLRVAITRAGTAVISGVPALSAAGHAYKITVTASNGIGRLASQILTIAIT